MKPGVKRSERGRKRGGTARFSVKSRVPLVVESCREFDERIMLTEQEADNDISVVIDMRGAGGREGSGVKLDR